MTGMPLTSERLREIVTELARRPRHEGVKVRVYELLVYGLGASSSEVDFERPVPEARGRIDALLGRTVFEFKSDLRREGRDAEEQLSRYLLDREAATGERYVGIATDGATFVPYELRRGSLRSLPQFTTNVQKPEDLLSWLGAAVAVSADLPPEPEVVRRELGRASLAWNRANHELSEAWAEVGHIPEVRLKRELWARLLERVYGSPVDADALFFQHTYLSTIARPKSPILAVPSWDSHMLPGFKSRWTTLRLWANSSPWQFSRAIPIALGLSFIDLLQKAFWTPQNSLVCHYGEIVRRRRLLVH